MVRNEPIIEFIKYGSVILIDLIFFALIHFFQFFFLTFKLDSRYFLNKNF